MSPYPGKSKLLLILAGLMLGLIAHRGAADDSWSPPPGAGILNVRDFGAVGDGKTDDTKAIRKAMNAMGERQTLFFPQGTYLISDTLQFDPGRVARDKQGKPTGQLVGSTRRSTFQGAQRDTTIIRLRDQARGFGAAAKPRHLIRTMTGNMAFDYSFRDLTIDTGKGNPGAIGILYISNNGGCMENVLVRSGDPDGRGAIGIDMSARWPGPALVQHVEVHGFDIGVKVAAHGGQYGMAFEYLSLQRQRVCGLENGCNVIAVRKLTSSNTVPALRNGKQSITTLVDAQLEQGKGDTAAIQNEAGGVLYLRNVRTSGYKQVLNGRDDVAVDELAVPAPLNAGPPTQDAFSLPVEDPPTVAWDAGENFANWLNAADFGAKPDDDEDDTAAIQKALDTAAAGDKHTVYLPRGTYHVGNQLRVHGSVRRVIGFWTILRITKAYTREIPVLRVESGQPVVALEGIRLKYWRWGGSGLRKGIDHAAQNTLVCRNIGSGRYVNSVTGGKAFFTDCGIRPFIKGPQQVWVRQWNPENFRLPSVRAENDGGRLWVLFTKGEGSGYYLRNVNGAKTEFLGGLALYPHHGDRNRKLKPDDYACFFNQDAAIRVTGWRSVFRTFADEQHGKQKQTWRRPKAPYNVSLFVSAPPPPPEP